MHIAPTSFLFLLCIWITRQCMPNNPYFNAFYRKQHTTIPPPHFFSPISFASHLQFLTPDPRPEQWRGHSIWNRPIFVGAHAPGPSLGVHFHSPQTHLTLCHYSIILCVQFLLSPVHISYIFLRLKVTLSIVPIPLLNRGCTGTHHRHYHAFRTVPSCTLCVSHAVARTVHTSCIRRPHQPENPMSASSGILLSCLYLPLRAYYYHTSATCLRCGLSLFLYNNSLLKIRLPLRAPTAYTDVRVLPGV